MPNIYIGTAGWGIPATETQRFQASGTVLERYSSVFPCVEINSSFHRSHRRETYARWADSTPDGFLFAVKMPREITHVNALSGCNALLYRFLGEAVGLGEKVGPLLVQLPPSRAFDPAIVDNFLSALRSRFSGPVVCEPRHASWFEPAADNLLASFGVARVAADPSRVPAAAETGGATNYAYYRLHGSPRIYYSPYAEGTLHEVAAALCERAVVGPAWCIFDNTASGAAVPDAVKLIEVVRRQHRVPTE